MIPLVQGWDMSISNFGTFSDSANMHARLRMAALASGSHICCMYEHLGILQIHLDLIGAGLPQGHQEFYMLASKIEGSLSYTCVPILYLFSMILIF